MLISPGSICIYVGSVVLDRPDQTGLYIAKDLAGGWAYMITDADGDARFRGNGACAGGMDVALRCAFLSAVGCVPDCSSIWVMVESRQSHVAMVRLAKSDAQAIATIAGRQVVVMTRPLERASYHVRNAAERAASGALQEREREEWELGETPALQQPLTATPTWRLRRGAGTSRAAPAAAPVRNPGTVPTGGRGLNGWLNSLESCVATVAGDLREIGA